jgi:glycosyltransferase involved in cell wall biosynthesis
MAARLARIPVVCHVRSQLTEFTVVERCVLRAVSRFVFVSEDTKTRFPPSIGSNRRRVLYDGVAEAAVDPEAGSAVRRELGLSTSAPIIGMVARISPQKDLLTLGRAAARVLDAHPEARFVVVGSVAAEEAHQRHFEQVRKELTRLGVIDSFVFTGFRSDVMRVMMAFDAFVLSTHTEGLPLVLLEAMSIGLPVIATAVNGIPEIIRRDEVGSLFAPSDDAALARHILRVIDDPARGRAMGTQGREFVRHEFSQATFAENLVDMYDELLAR